MKLVVEPQRFDVVVTTNQFGDILTDIGAGLVGGLGLAPGLCIGEKQAMAQATHGSAPDISGRNIANPYAMIMSGQMLMGWLGRKHKDAKASAAADLIQKAVTKVIAEGKHLTPDLGGSASTTRNGRRDRRRAMTTTTAKANGRTTMRRIAEDDLRPLLGLLCACAGARRRARLAADAADQADLPVPGRRRHRPDRAHRRACSSPSGSASRSIVENRGGANGGLGAQEVMRAEPDGYTLGAISDSPMTVNPWMYEKLAYPPLRDFIAVARINHFPSLLVAQPLDRHQDRRRPDQASPRRSPAR